MNGRNLKAMRHASMSVSADRLEDNDPLETVPFLPSHIYLQADDNPEEVIEAWEEVVNAHSERYYPTFIECLFRRETRFADEDEERPMWPVISRTVHSAPKDQRKFLTLPDGRRVRRLFSKDSNFRIETLCGIREILSKADAIAKYSRKVGKTQCRQCHGFHLPGASPQAHPPTPPMTRCVPCGKCRADLRTSAYQVDEWTWGCRLCGYRIARPNPTGLYVEEIESDSAAGDAFRSCRDRDPMDCDQEYEEGNPDAAEDMIEDVPNEEDRLCPDDRLHRESCEEWSCSLPLDTEAAQVEELRQMLAAIGDVLHRPALHFFRSFRSRLRQALVSQALLNEDNPATRMAVWAAAGRFLETRSASPSPTEAQDVADWLVSLSDTDLSLFAGDPEASLPGVCHPDVRWFEPADRLLDPLAKHLQSVVRHGAKTEGATARFSQLFHVTPAVIERFLTSRVSDASDPIAA